MKSPSGPVWDGGAWSVQQCPSCGVFITNAIAQQMREERARVRETSSQLRRTKKAAP